MDEIGLEAASGTAAVSVVAATTPLGEKRVRHRFTPRDVVGLLRVFRAGRRVAEPCVALAVPLRLRSSRVPPRGADARVSRSQWRAPTCTSG